MLLTATVTYRSWRDAKRSPYYFLRVQAAKRMQSYMAAGIAIGVLTAIVSIYAWQAPTDTTPRIIVLQNTKPTFNATPVTGSDEAVVAEVSPDIVTINLGSATGDLFDSEVGGAEVTVSGANLANESGEADPKARSEGTSIGPIYFSTDISANYQAIDPGSGFTAGYFTLYATFNYESMEEGASWSWVWKRNGQAIEGGDQVWSYGSDGPGYVYFQPEEGFQLGEHSLEVWVADRLMSQSNFSIIEGVSASN